MILITGASGFIGKHLLLKLVEKYGFDKVLALTSIPVKISNYLLHDNYQFNRDYFVKNGFDNIEIIIHAGAYTPKNNTQANDWEKCNSNVTNTLSLLNADFPKLKKVIYLSTLDVYSNVEGVISESTLINPATYYGESKYFSEKIVGYYCQFKGIDHQILRIGHVYGPGEENYQKLIPITFKKILSHQNIEIWGTGKDLRSFIYIDDIVSAIIKSIEIMSGIGPINVVSGIAYSVQEIVSKMIKISAQEVVVKNISTDAQGRDLVFDNSLMKKHLQESELPIEIGLKNEWNYMKGIK